MHDSFLNSHSDDSDREKNLQKFLQDAALSSEKLEEKPPSLSDMIDLSKKMNSFEKRLKVCCFYNYLYKKYISIFSRNPKIFSLSSLKFISE